MHLTFKKRHLSIIQFPDVEIPSFTVVVGLNGSGKSHLLQAMQNGSVANDIVQVDIKSHQDFDRSLIKLIAQGATGFDPNNTYISDAIQNQNQPVKYDELFFQLRDRMLDSLKIDLISLIGQDVYLDIKSNSIWEYDPDYIIDTFRFSHISDKIRKIYLDADQELAKGVVQVGRRVPGPASDAEVMSRAKELAQRSGTRISALKSHHFKLYGRFDEVDQLNINLPLVFGRYRDAQLRNRMMLQKEIFEGGSDALSEDDFVKKFGQPPWDILNGVLRSFSLPYEFVVPNRYEYDTVSVLFKSSRNGELVKFQNLSSGERVLTQFAVSSFNYESSLLNMKRPKILLLDEMDASLHPEMLARWLGAIQNSFIKDYGINCVIATHSPTTVALVPQESIFEMVGGEGGLVKISKQEALNKLTFGVPTLSIDYSGRRQVFTESRSDAKIYEDIYSRIKSFISCNRELNFISSGFRDKAGDKNSGCAIVRQIVGSLVELGNSSVFGVVDWDGEAQSSGHVRVLSEGVRDGIENVILDPLLICLLLMKGRKAPKEVADLERFAGVPSLDGSSLQRLVDSVQYKIFPNSIDLVDVEYLGGASCRVVKDYLTEDDHALENKILSVFPDLNKWSKGRSGALVMAVVDEVLTEYPSFCPADIRHLFEAIANSEI